MKIHSRFALAALLICLSPLRAGPEPPSMETWAKAKSIFYRVEGVYSGKASLAWGDGGAQADVTDRVLLDFEWNFVESTLVHPIAVENFPTSVTNLRNAEPKCKTPTVKGTYEHATVLEMSAGMAGTLALRVERVYPNVDVPQFCTGKPKLVRGRKDVSPMEIVVPSPVFFSMALPKDGPAQVSTDGKSIILKDRGWTWTCTPSLSGPRK